MSNKCSICKEDVSNIFTLRKCSHGFCAKCVCDYISKQVKKRVIKIKCPLNNCKGFIADADIRQCLSNDDINFYDDLSIHSASPNAKKCFTADCPAMFVYTDNYAGFDCYYCKQYSCLICNKRHRPGSCKNCEDQKTIEEAAQKEIQMRKRDDYMKLNSESDLVPNPDVFECSICCQSFLPRTNVILRNCLHNFCRICLKSSFETSKFLNQFNCPICKADVAQRELKQLVSEGLLAKMSVTQARARFFACQFTDCDGIVDIAGQCAGTFICPQCKHVNCIACGDIHENMTCTEFQNTEKFRKKMKNDEFISKFESRKIECCCGQLLIQNGGCGALKCCNCNRQVCVFTGKIAGNKGPESCGCTPDKPCDTRCRHGCIPDFD